MIRLEIGHNIDEKFKSFEKLIQFLDIYIKINNPRDHNNDMTISVYNDKDAEILAGFIPNKFSNIFKAFKKCNDEYKELWCRFTLDWVPIFICISSPVMPKVYQDFFEHVYNIKVGDYVWCERERRYGYISKDPSKFILYSCLNNGKTFFRSDVSRFDLRVLSEIEVRHLHLEPLKKVADSEDPEITFDKLPDKYKWMFYPIK